MKIFSKTALVASLLSAGLLSAASAIPSNWKLYAPGAKDADVVKDLEAQGMIASPTAGAHFSFLDADGGKKVLLLNTLDGKNEAFAIPLTGKEKKVTVIFKARGDVNPDSPATPYGILWASVQNGVYQSVLRHNASNQIKGSTGQTSMKPDNIVSDWHEFRLVYDTDDGVSYTATAFIDGKQRHQTKNYKKDKSDFPVGFQMGDDGSYVGQGNYVMFGENDNSTSGFARYAYVLVVADEDVSGQSLAQLSSKAGYDLAGTPKIAKDKNPPSKRPANKPSSINMVGSDFPEMKEPANYKDPSAITGKSIDLNSLPYSKAKAEKVTAKPAKIKGVKYAATVSPNVRKNTSKKFSTISAAVEAVEPGSYIRVKPGFYNEKIRITKPGIKLIGSDPSRTVIYGYEADTGGINGNLLVEVNLLPVGTDTTPGVKADSPAVNADDASFSAVNITFYNKGAEWNNTWGYTERRSIALALMGVQKCYLENCLFLGQQDTLYFRSGRIYAKNCYIEGEVDFICGGATTLFDNCHIYSLFYKNGGYITAAAPADTANSQTAKFAKGYVFKDCLVSANEQTEKNSKKVYLGRGAWTGGSAATGPAKSIFINCQLGKHIDPAGWLDWDNVNTVEKSYFREYKCTGDGAVEKEGAKRKFMTDAEYEEYSTVEKILGYTPSL